MMTLEDIRHLHEDMTQESDEGAGRTLKVTVATHKQIIACLDCAITELETSRVGIERCQLVADLLCDCDDPEFFDSALRNQLLNALAGKDGE